MYYLSQLVRLPYYLVEKDIHAYYRRLDAWLKVRVGFLPPDRKQTVIADRFVRVSELIVELSHSFPARRGLDCAEAMLVINKATTRTVNNLITYHL